LRIQRVLSDFNGTLATDGRLSEGVAERLLRLAELLPVEVLTADTHGTAAEELKGLEKVRLVRLAHDALEAEQKRDRVQEAGAERAAFLGNGANDEAAMAAAGFSVAVVGREGAFLRTLENADLVVFRPEDGLDLLLHPARLVAGLRR
jgi:soluble P-type ATPase